LSAAERELVCTDLNAGLDRLRAEGFRLDVIYPADDPHSAILRRENERVRLTTQPGAQRPSGDLPPFVPEFMVNRGGGSAGEGRAGMFYRDLIPDRLGGRYVASLITIPDGGPVSDWVHFHRVAFQMIFVRSGWVRVVYEDQGDPFIMRPGDLVLQPPQIRHRVLESSPRLEVIEIGCPALHETLADHDLNLPTTSVNPERDFEGQRFLRHVAADKLWTPFLAAEAQETGLSGATGGVADARIVRPTSATELDFPPHDGELVFGFVLEGRARLEFEGSHNLEAGDCFVVPPTNSWSLQDVSPDFRLLHVTTTRLG
jgi:mannose-6-phosphate isomerase-like protein (cupin superfamily)